MVSVLIPVESHGCGYQANKFHFAEIVFYIMGLLTFATGLACGNMGDGASVTWGFVWVSSLLMLIPKFVVGHLVEKDKFKEVYKPFRILIICQWLYQILFILLFKFTLAEVYDLGLLDEYRAYYTAGFIIYVNMVLCLLNTIQYYFVLRTHMKSESVQSKDFMVNVMNLVNNIYEAEGKGPKYKKEDIKKAKKEVS